MRDQGGPRGIRRRSVAPVRLRSELASGDRPRSPSRRACRRAPERRRARVPRGRAGIGSAAAAARCASRVSGCAPASCLAGRSRSWPGRTRWGPRWRGASCPPTRVPQPSRPWASPASSPSRRSPDPALSARRSEADPGLGSPWMARRSAPGSVPRLARRRLPTGGGRRSHASSRRVTPTLPVRPPRAPISLAEPERPWVCRGASASEWDEAPRAGGRTSVAPGGASPRRGRCRTPRGSAAADGLRSCRSAR